MNVQAMKDFVEDHGVVMMKADNTNYPPDIQELLLKLGNKTRQLPFYAIFPAGRANKPVVMFGLYTGPGAFIDKLKELDAASNAMAVSASK